MGYKKGEVLKTAFESYTVLRSRGGGGSGEVYEVVDGEGASFAVKILNQERATTSRLKRFKNEIHFCSKTCHSHIVPVVGHGVADDGATFYVMPLYAGTLRNIMKEGLAREAALPYYGQILSGVQAAHLMGVWHRDLKPENILLSAKRELVIADFGIAHFEEEELLTAVETQDQERLANFEYAAPEQRHRGGKVSDKADIYSLGLILNELFTQSVPHGTGFRKIADSAPGFAYLDGLVDLMLRQDPDARPNIEQVMRELQRRGDEFVAVQRLSTLRSQVIPETEVDDPFIREPIRVVAVDYAPGYLRYKLSAAPPPHWIMAFMRPSGGYSSYYGRGPNSVHINGNEAVAPISGAETPEQWTIYMKNFVELANQQYKDNLIQQHRKDLEARRRARERAIREEEERQAMLARIAKIQL